MNIPVALQLYSVRDYVSEDMIGTLKKVKEIGYDAVEFAGYEGFSAEDLKSILDDIGLVALSSHVGLEELENNPEDVLDYSVKLGLKYVVCPHSDASNLESIKRTCDILNRIAPSFKEKGIKLGYHNHDGEFKKFDNKYAFDLLLEMTAESEVYAQIDTYWVLYAGIDPMDYIKSIGDRMGLYHFKDIIMSDKDRGVNVGDGDINFKEMVEYTLKTGIGKEGIIVEQEGFDGDPFECLKASCDYIKALLKEGV